ncbi:MAG: NAD(P)/FAD-dependent oxidoreductase [Leptospiraceae bacterium]|nr:NAD(P)/FAD-dependent oxidoreductase [Leptospiraceae bacterium]
MAVETGSEYDVIVIGSGIGGLAAASFLARLQNKRVLVLERHFKIGGFTHIFKRKQKYLWDVGIHYIGNVGEGQMMRGIFDALTQSQVKWQQMPHIFEKFVYPEFTFDVPSNEEEYIKALQERFPDEARAISNYFRDIKSTANWFARHITMKAMPRGISAVAHLLELYGKGSALMKTADYMDQNFRDPNLKAILCSQWGDYGLPPTKSAFVMHSLVASHYLEGGWYPVGGSGTIAASIVPQLESRGGAALVDHTVDRILVENGKAVGVQCRYVTGDREQAKEYRAPVIISNAGALNTYLHLLPPDYPLPFRDQLKPELNSISCVTLYLGLNKDPRSLGFQGENHWIFSSTNHDQNFANRAELLEGKPGGAFLSFPSLKDDESEGHTAEIIAFCDYEPFRKWADKPWMKRGADYLELKSKIAATLLDYIEQHYPGFKAMVEYQELSTPLSNSHFANHVDGSIYGLATSPERFNADWLGINTPIDNLFLAGADASSPGVSGALMGGISCAARVMGMSGFMKFFRQLEPMAKGEL